MKARLTIQIVPVMMFLPGLGQSFQLNRRATRGQMEESRNGKISKPTSTIGGMTSDMISSGPSLRN
jgi:hypothetical protein